MAELTLLEAAQIAEDSAASSVGGTHVTTGLPGWYALDIFAVPYSTVVAPEEGTIERFSGHDPSEGVVGAGGIFGRSLYLHGVSGTDYYMTHLDHYLTREGAHVAPGGAIAVEGDFPASSGIPDHVHWAVHGPDPASVLIRDAEAMIGAGGNQPPPGGVPAPQPTPTGGGSSPCKATVTTVNTDNMDCFGIDMACLNGTLTTQDWLAAVKKHKCPSSLGPTGVGAIDTPIQAAKGVFNAAVDLEHALAFVFSFRFLEILGGGLLILVGLSALSRALGGPKLPAVPTPG